jgi:hypothetical protein
MSPKLQEMIDNGKDSERQVIEFLVTLKKLSDGDFFDKRNFKMVIDHFGFKQKKGYLKLSRSVKYKI